MTRPIVILLAAVLMAPTGGAQDSRLSALREHAAADLVGELDVYVADCQRQKLYAERDRTCELIIELHPGNEMARKWLGYKRDRSGGWQEPKRRRAARDFDDEALAEMRARLVGIVTAYADRLTAFYEENATEISRQERQGLFADVLRFDPGNAFVRGIRNEVEVDGEWLLAESVSALARRAELTELIRKLTAEAGKPQRIVLREAELELGLPIRHSLATASARVHVTGELEEAQRTAAALPLTLQVFRWAFGGVNAPKATYPADMTVYVLAGPGEVGTFLDHHFAVDASYRAFLVTLEASIIRDSGDFAAWSVHPSRRIDAIVSMATAWLAAGAFEIGTSQGWLFQGLSFYTTHRILGTRLNWFVRPGRYEEGGALDDLRSRLIDPDTDWFREAYYLLKDKPLLQKPILDALIRKDVSALQPGDLLYGTILTSYLIEGRPEAAHEVALGIGAGGDPRKVFEEAFDLPLEALEPRIVRWLEETGAGG